MAVSAGSLVAICILISLSALFSGLTLGLMSLDMVGLQIVIQSGQRPEVRARVRARHPPRARRRRGARPSVYVRAVRQCRVPGAPSDARPPPRLLRALLDEATLST